MLYRLGEDSPLLNGGGHFVAPNAAVIGRVTLEANSSVWFSCVLRGGTHVEHNKSNAHRRSTLL